MHDLRPTLIFSSSSAGVFAPAVFSRHDLLNCGGGGYSRLSSIAWLPEAAVLRYVVPSCWKPLWNTGRSPTLSEVAEQGRRLLPPVTKRIEVHCESCLSKG